MIQFKHYNILYDDISKPFRMIIKAGMFKCSGIVHINLVSVTQLKGNG